MNTSVYKRNHFTLAEHFFSQKIIELFNHNTVDSYRVRLHNPKTILIEFSEVLEGFRQMKVRNFDLTIGNINSETEELMALDKHLVFKKINKKYFTGLLKNLDVKNYLETLVACKIIISENQNYISTLFEGIKQEILRLNCLAEEGAVTFNELASITGFLATELRSTGISKQYLFHLSKSLFGGRSSFSFSQSIDEFMRVLVNRQEITFKVYFRVSFSDINVDSLKERIKEIQDKNTVDQLFKDSKDFRIFVSEDVKRFPHLLCYRVNSLDYYSAVKSARAQVSEIRDFLKMGYSDRNITIYKKALISSGDDFAKYQVQTFHYFIDGRADTSENLYDSFLRNYVSIRNNTTIYRETKDKLQSAIRYFRLGEESFELEQRYINYWIGIEYLFSSQFVSESTFTRFKLYFSKLHSLTYLKRNLKVFHESLKKLHTASEIPNLDDNLEYLYDISTYSFLEKLLFISEPLLAFRAQDLRIIISDSKKLVDYLQKHCKNIEYHLARIYRVRNEIVHEAAIKPDIENLAANLRYYLVYTIYTIIDFFTVSQEDIKVKDLYTIDDFFMIKSLYFDSAVKSKQTEIFLNAPYGNILY